MSTQGFCNRRGNLDAVVLACPIRDSRVRASSFYGFSVPLFSPLGFCYLFVTVKVPNRAYITRSRAPGLYTFLALRTSPHSPDRPADLGVASQKLPFLFFVAPKYGDLIIFMLQSFSISV